MDDGKTSFATVWTLAGLGNSGNGVALSLCHNGVVTLLSITLHADSVTLRPFEEKDSPAVGQIGLWPGKRETASVGYWLLASTRGKGVASAALAALSRFGMGQFERLELYVEPWNVAFWRTAEKVGYRREGLMRKFQEIGGERKDLYLYSLLRGEAVNG